MDTSIIDQKHVLYIVHEFPPISGGQINRALKFTKYLPEFGWNPIVLTAEPEDCFYRADWAMDISNLAEIAEGTRVYRVASPLERISRDLFKTEGNTTTNNDHRSEGIDKSMGVPLSRHLMRSLKRHHVVQDQSALWLPWAYRKAIELIRTHKPTAMVTSGPPHLIHVLGLALKKQTGIPWIADFRDGWTDNVLFSASSETRRRVDQQIERRVVNNADSIVGVTKHICNHFMAEYPLQSDKVHLIYNGYDKSDFSNITGRVHVEPISFVHVGGIGGIRDPKPLILAFQAIFENNLLSMESVKVQFVGKYHGATTELPEWVEVIPYLPHDQAIRTMMSAGVLLLVAGSTEGEAAFTSKVFEYLAAQRPILALIPEKGELAELLQSYSIAEIVSPDNGTKIQQSILRIFEKASESMVLSQSDRSIIERFDRFQQTGQLADLLDTLQQ